MNKDSVLIVIAPFVIGLFVGLGNAPGLDKLISIQSNIYGISIFAGIFGLLFTGFFISSRDREERNHKDYFKMLFFCLGGCTPSLVFLILGEPIRPFILLCAPILVAMIIMGVANESFNKGN